MDLWELLDGVEWRRRREVGVYVLGLENLVSLWTKDLPHGWAENEINRLSAYTPEEVK